MFHLQQSIGLAQKRGQFQGVELRRFVAQLVGHALGQAERSLEQSLSRPTPLTRGSSIGATAASEPNLVSSDWATSVADRPTYRSNRMAISSLSRSASAPLAEAVRVAFAGGQIPDARGFRLVITAGRHCVAGGDPAWAGAFLLGRLSALLSCGFACAVIGRRPSILGWLSMMPRNFFSAASVPHGALEQIVQLQWIVLEVVPLGDLRLVSKPDFVALVAENAVGEVALHAVFVEPSAPWPSAMIELRGESSAWPSSRARTTCRRASLPWAVALGQEQVGGRSEKSVSASVSHPQDEAGGVHDERLANASYWRPCRRLAVAADRTAQASAGAVVGGEDHNRALADFQFVQRGDQPPAEGVGVAHHPLQLVPAGWRCARPASARVGRA